MLANLPTQGIDQVKSLLELLVAAGFFIGVVWQMAEMKSAIYRTIDSVNDSLNDRINQIEKRFDVHINDYERSADLTTLICNQLREAIEHKCKRLYNSMRDIEKYLQKNQNFRIREYFSDDSSRLDDE